MSIPEMGHASVTDLEALKTGSTTAWHLAEEAVFPGESELVRERRDLTVVGQSFRIEFRLQQDSLGLNCEYDRAMVALRFLPIVHATLACPWTLHVRGDWPERKDRLPNVGPLSAKALRKAVAPRHRQQTDPYRDTFMSDDVYVMARTPLDDLTAQIVLFVLQTGLSVESELFRWLENYIEHTFRIRVRDRKDVARDVTLRLIRNKWWTEDARAWRKYLARLCFVCARQYVLTGGSPIFGRAQLPADRDPYEPSGTLLSVDDASRSIGVSRSTLYALIARGRVAVERRRGRMLITRTEVARLVATTRLGTVIGMVAIARGSSKTAARKYVSRLAARGHSLEQIAKRFAPQKPDPRP